MGILYLGERAIYQDDKTGFSWDSPKMQRRLNPDGTPFTGDAGETVATTVVSSPEETQTVIEEPEKPNLTCDVCGFEAKSIAGLSVHKMKHRG